MLAWVGLLALFAIGAMLGLVLGVVLVFWVSLVRGARAVHAEGVMCRAEVIARDGVVGPLLAGPAIVRLSGAFEGPATAPTCSGSSSRLQRHAADPAIGDQDLVFGTFESFATASRDRALTDVGDYIANKYSSVTPWWTPSLGARDAAPRAAAAGRARSRHRPARAARRRHRGGSRAARARRGGHGNRRAAARRAARGRCTLAARLDVPLRARRASGRITQRRTRYRVSDQPARASHPRWVMIIRYTTAAANRPRFWPKVRQRGSRRDAP